MKCYGRQPDSGNPTVRDDNGGYRKRGRDFGLINLAQAGESKTRNIDARACNLPTRSSQQGCESSEVQVFAPSISHSDG